MRCSTIALAAAAATAVSAQRPSATPICDYYTTALLKDNTAKNQATVLTLLVNTVVIGNYTMPNTGVSVAGILAKGTVNGTAVDLAPYFNGDLASANRNGKATAVNFLDGGGAAPLMKSMPADDTSSNQYFLLTHLYEFFGSLLGCSMQGMSGFDAYAGEPSMYEVHQFMDLNYAQVTYFIEQVGLAAKSFGVTDADITIVADALSTTFNVRCGPAATAIKAQGSQLQSICIDSSCPLAKDSDCSKYATAVAPKNATSTASTSPSGSATGTGSTAPSGTSSTSSVPSSGAVSHGYSLAALVAGVAAFAL